MAKNSTGLRPLPGDWLLIGLLFFIGILLTGFLYLPGQLAGSSSDDARQLEVYSDGTLLMALPLSQDIEKTTNTNRGTNTFHIKDGIASMTDADCNDHTCIRTGGISHTGETIVCLPHRLVLRIADREDADTGPDAVVH
ncbi:MAG: NusG domain II-containing protein [Lachnospiraceae bacterium]|nr:NusG domain II-containing protein [Lachnospiraceae bacterium]